MHTCGHDQFVHGDWFKVQVQNMTNQFVASIDKVCSAKEKELQVL